MGQGGVGRPVRKGEREKRIFLLLSPAWATVMLPANPPSPHTYTHTWKERGRRAAAEIVFWGWVEEEEEVRSNRKREEGVTQRERLKSAKNVGVKWRC